MKIKTTLKTSEVQIVIPESWTSLPDLPREEAMCVKVPNKFVADIQESITQTKVKSRLKTSEEENYTQNE